MILAWLGYWREGCGSCYFKDAPPDGQKMALPEIHLVLNRFEELKAKVPAAK
jgi:hypothetical protein